MILCSNNEYVANIGDSRWLHVANIVDGIQFGATPADILPLLVHQNSERVPFETPELEPRLWKRSGLTKSTLQKGHKMG